MDKQTFISFESMQNFRDIGGCTLEDGRNMKLGVVFRSEELSRMSIGDRNKLKELGIKCIIDLRTPNERSWKPYEISGDTGMQIVQIPILSEEKDRSRWQFFWLLIREGRNLTLRNTCVDFIIGWRLSERNRLSRFLRYFIKYALFYGKKNFKVIVVICNRCMLQWRCNTKIT